jgi:hypothetical protein
MNPAPLTPHPYANLFPLMSDEELGPMIQDMRENGYRTSDPICLYNGQILDGRNRYRAANLARVEPTFETFTGTLGEALQYVVSRNVNRRHLTDRQRAAIAADVAMATRRDNLKVGPNPQNAGSGSEHKPTTPEVAAAFNLSTDQVERAKKRKKEDPAAHAAKAGVRVKPKPRKKKKEPEPKLGSEEDAQREAEFHARVNARVQEFLETVILPQLKKEQDQAKLVMRRRKGVITKKEFLKIVECLHPDRVQDPVHKPKYEEAFKIFYPLEKVLVDEKGSPTTFSSFPNTVAGWEELRRQGEERRKAKKNGQTPQNGRDIK